MPSRRFVLSAVGVDCAGQSAGVIMRRRSQPVLARHAMTPQEAREYRAFLLQLAALAGDAVLPWFRRPLEVGNKGDGRFDPVTVADREAERVMREAILARYPSHGLQGEEFGEQAGTSAMRWVIDPIDGTRAFISGVPTWGTLVALCENGVPVLGMMSQPFVGEIFLGGPGGAEHQRAGAVTVLRTRGTSQLAEASLFATTPEMFQPDEWAAFGRVSAAVRLTRFGIDCYAYALLAAGHVDLVIEAGLGFYDIAPLIPLIEAAGGIVTDWRGAPVRSGGRVLAAANAELHAQALRHLEEVNAA